MKKKKISSQIKWDYPRIKQLGLVVVEKPVEHINSVELQKRLKELGIQKEFNKYFGIQTQYADDDGHGHPYVYDVESTLERIFSKREGKENLTGTQHPLLWD